jgi:hypothetical protein
MLGMGGAMPYLIDGQQRPSRKNNSEPRSISEATQKKIDAAQAKRDRKNKRRLELLRNDDE